MFAPFQSGTGEDARPNWDNGVVTAGRFKAHVQPTPPQQAGHSAKRRRRLSTRESIASIGPQEPEKVTVYQLFMRPTRSQVDRWLSSWYKRWAVLVLIPCTFVWLWVSVPFPVSDPYEPGSPWRWGWPWKDKGFNSASLFLKMMGRGALNGTEGAEEGEPEVDLPLDVNFLFFLLFYFGCYLHVALIFTTQLFNLYRLNWWPKKIGGAISYFFFWSFALLVGFVVHQFDLIGAGGRHDGKSGDYMDWERKSFWIGLTFATMACPAFVCFSVLKRDKRHVLNRQSLTPMQKAFYDVAFQSKLPASYLRFLWFVVVIGLAGFALMAGQAYTSVFLSTLPHSSIDAAVWVWSWIGTTTVLNLGTSNILENRVRSRGLLFLFKYFNYLVYFVFYRNLFARLRKVADFALVQGLSSLFVIIFYPLQMSWVFHRALQLIIGYKKSLNDHRDAVAVAFYTRGVAQNLSMAAFLGWLVILHYGPNSAVYPFFRFTETPTEDDPYTFSFTFIASGIIWSSELASSFITRQICRVAYRVDVTNTGLDIMKMHPELVAAMGWTSVHVLSNILMFLLKLNFR